MIGSYAVILRGGGGGGGGGGRRKPAEDVSGGKGYEEEVVFFWGGGFLGVCGRGVSVFFFQTYWLFRVALDLSASVFVPLVNWL